MAGRKRFTERYNLPTARAAAPALQPFPKYPDYQGQQLRDALATERLNQIPLQNAAREAQIAHARASEAEVRVRIRKQINTDNQKAAFYDGLQELESNLDARGMPIGSKGHSEAFAAYAHEFPLARSTKSVQDYLKLHSAVNDDQAALTQRMNQSIQAGQSLGLTPEGASFIKGGQVDVRFRQPGTDTEGSDPEAELYKSHSLTKQQFLNPINPVQGVIDDKGNFTRNFSPGQQATAIQFQGGNSKTAPGTQITHVMPLNEFNSYQQAFQQQPLLTFVAPQTAQPAQTPAPVVQSPTVQPSTTPDQTPIYTPSPSPEATATPPPLADIFADQPQTP